MQNSSGGHNTQNITRLVITVKKKKEQGTCKLFFQLSEHVSKIFISLKKKKIFEKFLDFEIWPAEKRKEKLIYLLIFFVARICYFFKKRD